MYKCKCRSSWDAFSIVSYAFDFVFCLVIWYAVLTACSSSRGAGLDLAMDLDYGIALRI